MGQGQGKGRTYKILHQILDTTLKSLLTQFTLRIQPFNSFDHTPGVTIYISPDRHDGNATVSDAESLKDGAWEDWRDDAADVGDTAECEIAVCDG